VRVSSGKLREWIQQGKLQKVRRLMKGPTIVAGKEVRKTSQNKGLGFATANLRMESGILPPVGVYAVRAWINKGTGYKVPGTPCFGMANLGFRPTFGGGEAKPLLEVHLFGLSHPLYRKRLEVEFVRRLRAERRFISPQALARQLVVDARRAKWYSSPLND
jgi:riboflavin kinase/FMN adenylyltransferase